MNSKITTRQGDGGAATALSGETVSKSHPIMQCVGAVDEIRANMALLRLHILEQNTPDANELGDFLEWLLQTLFIIGAQCSDPEGTVYKEKLEKKHLDMLEAEQARLEKRTKLPDEFILTASTIPAAHADVTCTVARSLERTFTSLTEAIPDMEPGVIPPFLNRLSDYLFILARHLDGLG